MTAIVRVARFEYLRHLRSKQFLGTTLGMPAFMLAVGVLAAWTGRAAQAHSVRPWGFVAAALPAEAAAVLADARLQPFADRAAADAALAAGTIGGYAVRDGQAQLAVRAWEPMPDGLDAALREAIVAEAAAAAPADVRPAWTDPARVRYALADAPDDTRSAAGLWATLGIAFAVPLGLTLAVLFSTTWLVTAVAEEKSNRLIECLVTSISPTALVAGKVVGLGLLALTQLAIWAVAGVAAVLVGLRVGVPIDAVGGVPWAGVALAGLWLLGGYLVQAAVVVALGVAIGEPREAQQVAGFASLGLVVPFSLTGLLLFRPASPAAVALSIVPLTSPVAMPIRLLLSAVPARDLVVSGAILAVTAAAALRGAGLVFRWAMLRPPVRWRWRARRAAAA